MRPASSTALLPSQSLGARIREARKARGLTQVDFATRMGVNRRAVQAWEGGENGIGRENLEALVGVLEVSESELRAAAGGADLATGEIAERLAHLDAKLDVLLRALGVDPAKVGAGGEAPSGEVVTVAEAWIDLAVQRFIAGFGESAEVLTRGRGPA